MGERISWADGVQQMTELQAMMMEALTLEGPHIGLLLKTDEPELLIEYLNRAKQKDPALQDIIISMKSMGVVVYHQVTGAKDGKED